LLKHPIASIPPDKILDEILLKATIPIIANTIAAAGSISLLAYRLTVIKEKGDKIRNAKRQHLCSESVLSFIPSGTKAEIAPVATNRKENNTFGSS
jgi:hypothetical protein